MESIHKECIDSSANRWRKYRSEAWIHHCFSSITSHTQNTLRSPHVFQNARLYIYHMHRVKAMFKEIYSQSLLCHHTLTTHHSHFLQLIKMNLHMALVGKPTALDEIVVPPATLTPNMCHCSSQCSLLVNSRPVNQLKNSLTHEVHPWSSWLIVILAYASIMVFHGRFCLTKVVKHQISVVKSFCLHYFHLFRSFFLCLVVKMSKET